MAYSANNSSNIISVTNFGANGNGAFNNKAILQNAINGLYLVNGGSLFFPKGNYYFSGTIDVTGKSISFLGEEGSVLLGAVDESAKKINVSGAENISFKKLTFDANRTGTSNVSNQLGFLNTTNSQNIKIEDCNFYNTKNSSIFLGPGSRSVDIKNNVFTGYFCGIYSFIDVGQLPSSGFKIDGNRFLDSYLTSEVSESAAIKLQTSTSQNNYSTNHSILNNYINTKAQMGIELWTNLANCAIEGNIIENSYWGISIDKSKCIIVDGNIIKNIATIGMEASTICENITFSNNIVDNFRTTGAFFAGSTTMLVSNGPQKIKIHGNFLRGFQEKGIHLRSSSEIDVQGNTILDHRGQCINVQNSQSVNLNNNIMGRASGFSMDNFIFFDYADSDVTGLSLQGNRFLGATTNQGIQIYRGVTPRSLKNVLIKNNYLDENVNCTNGVMWYSNFEDIKNILIVGNYGPTGQAPENTISDYSAVGYSQANIYAGIQYYKNGTILVPNGGITGRGLWYKIYDTVGNGGPFNPKIRIVAGEDSSYDNTRTNADITAALNPYGGNSIKHSLTLQSQSPYGNSGTFLQEVRTSYSGDGSQVWIRLGPVNTTGNAFSLYYTDQYGVSYPSGTYIEPNWPSESAQIINIDTTLPNNSLTLLKTSYGMAMGTKAAIYSPSSGNITVKGNLLAQDVLTAYNYKMTDVSLPMPIMSGGASGRLNLNFSGAGLQNIIITGATIISGINYSVGSALTVRMFATSPSQALGWAPWKFIGSTSPTGLATSKTAILSLQCFNNTDTGVVAAYSVEP